jgi:CBS domain-containing protein
MRSIEAIRRSGIGIGPERTIHDAAVVMEQTGVGSLVVIDDARIVGIVTDRDLVRRGLATGLPADARVDGIMSAPVVTLGADDDLHSAFALFRTHAVRRLAVVRDEQFVGMITVDDLLIDLAADLAALSWPITAEVLFGHHDSPVPATR